MSLFPDYCWLRILDEQGRVLGATRMRFPSKVAVTIWRAGLASFWDMRDGNTMELLTGRALILVRAKVRPNDTVTLIGGGKS